MGISIMGTSWDIPIIFRLNNNHRCPTIIYFYEGFKDIQLLGGFNRSEKYESMGRIIPNIWKNKKCSKPPTSTGIYRVFFDPRTNHQPTGRFGPTAQLVLTLQTSPPLIIGYPPMVVDTSNIGISRRWNGEYHGDGMGK